MPMNHGLKPIRRRPAPRGASMRFLLEVALLHDTNECLIWPHGRNADGYGRIRIGKNHEYAHRFVCKRAHGAPTTSKHQAAHTCGRGHDGCVAPAHLEWKTPKENAADRIAHGTSIFRKQTPRRVEAIRNLRGVMQHRTLGKLFRLSGGAVSRIVRRRTHRA